MTKFRKFTDWLWINQWIAGAVMYVVICVWTYLTAHVEIEGVALPQHDAGIIALAVMHGIILFAIGAAYLLNTIFNLFGKLRKNKNDD